MGGAGSTVGRWGTPTAASCGGGKGVCAVAAAAVVGCVYARPSVLSRCIFWGGVLRGLYSVQ